VGGLALAHGLLASGHGVRVLEKAPNLRSGGAAMTIFSNGTAALSGLGITLDGCGAAISAMCFYSASGKPLFRVRLDSLQRLTGFPVIAISRDRLISRLARGLPEDIFVLDAAVRDVRLVSSGVSVSDSAGANHVADVLVGADGYNSAVRRAILGPSPAAGTGWASRQGLAAILPEVAAGTEGRYFVGDAGFVGLMPAGDGLLQWWIDTPYDPAGPAQESPAAWLRARFAHYADPVPQLLDHITDADIGLYPHVRHSVPAMWGTGPTTLVGDAAHAFPPSQAQGANQALEDAWLLSRALHDCRAAAELPGLLRRYEDLRVPRVRRVSRLAGSETTNKPPTFLKTAIARVLPGPVVGRAYTMLIRRWSSVLGGDQP